ncbi:MAG: tRNA (adenosine(37)-N6)-threonylcarbamoyltransferase complex ATPase subunit type 1 TsaE [Actinomycetota bacterium]|nr:tRNA (adenosine(37)-N6)-threonylcarbamoyltransferase complex ATPase subunit type 1 TsaE [Actinomycetota bacterium]
MVELESSSPEETERIGATLARHLERGDVVTVSGELGAGKTTFVRGACQALGVTSPVTSPTYAIGNRYAGVVPVSHLDLYRFVELTEPDWADLEPYFEDAITFVEWPEAGEPYLSRATASVRLQLVAGERRLVTVQAPTKPLQMAPSCPPC